MSVGFMKPRKGVEEELNAHFYILGKVKSYVNII